MKIFGLGLPELLIILVVVLLIFGPKNLPKLGAMLGRTVKKIRGKADKDFDGVDEGGEPDASRKETAAAARGKGVSAGDKQLPAATPKKKVVRKIVRKPAVEADGTLAEEAEEPEAPQEQR